MPSRRNCGEYWTHDYQDNGKGREVCTRCAKLNPHGVPPYIRFWDYVTKLPAGCWTWGGYITEDGYGHFTVNQGTEKRVTVKAHKYAWFLLRGIDKAPGTEFDHLCYNRACVNPDHLRTVPHLVNMANRRNSGKCRKGHEMTGENRLDLGTYNGKPHVRCRICYNAYMTRLYPSRKVKA